MTNVKYVLYPHLSKRTEENHSRYSWYPGWDSIRILPKYKPKQFPIEPTCSMEDSIKTDRKVIGYDGVDLMHVTQYS
jgi:hypothetical protein